MKNARLYLTVLLLIFFLSSLSPATQAQISTPFLIPPSFPGADQAVTADFNGDGKPDIVNADGTVLLGNGDGTFTAGTLLQVGGPNARNLIATADFNGDGKPDLVFASPASNTFYVLLGNGDGTFQAPIITNVASPFSALIVGDVNGDGKPDVLGVPSVSGGLFTYLGNGNGTFAPGVMSGAATAGGARGLQWRRQARSGVGERHTTRQRKRHVSGAHPIPQWFAWRHRHRGFRWRR